MASVRSALTGKPGVQTVDVDLDRKQAKVVFDDRQATVQALLAAVDEAGYPAKTMA